MTFIDVVGTFYKRWFASRLATDPSSRDLSISKHKHTLFHQLHGKVLEIGAGTGTNFRYFPSDIRWYGIESNRYTEPYLKEEAKKYGFTTLHNNIGTAERLPFHDHMFDAVVSTHVLCSVDDITPVLSEIRRVLKHGGAYYFLEHVRSPNLLRRFLQTILFPVWWVIADGCHLNRNIEKEIRRSSFRRVDVENFQAKIPIVSDHIAGIATV